MLKIDVVSRKRSTTVLFYVVITILVMWIVSQNQVPPNIRSLNGEPDCWKSPYGACEKLPLDKLNSWTGLFMQMHKQNYYLSIDISAEINNAGAKVTWLKGKPDNYSFSEKIIYNTLVEKIDSKGQSLSKVQESRGEILMLDCHPAPQQLGRVPNGEKKMVCEYDSVLTIYNFEDTNYKVTIEIVEAATLSLKFSNLYVNAYTIHSTYVNWLLKVRTLFLLLSLFAIFKYTRNLTKLNGCYWSYEQRAILYLSVLLLTFNDPLSYINVQVPSIGLYFLSAIGKSSFQAYLVQFWLTMFQRIHQENSLRDTKVDFRWKKMVALVYFCFLLQESFVYSELYMSIIFLRQT